MVLACSACLALDIPEHSATTDSSPTQPAHGGTFVLGAPPARRLNNFDSLQVPFTPQPPIRRSPIKRTVGLSFLWCPTGASFPRHQLSPNPDHLATIKSSLDQPAHGGTFVLGAPPARRLHDINSLQIPSTSQPSNRRSINQRTVGLSFLGAPPARRFHDINSLQIPITSQPSNRPSPNQRTVGLLFSVPHRRVVSSTWTLSRSRSPRNHRIVPYPTSARWDFCSRCPTGASSHQLGLSPDPDHLATTESSLTQPAHGGTFVLSAPPARRFDKFDSLQVPNTLQPPNRRPPNQRTVGLSFLGAPPARRLINLDSLQIPITSQPPNRPLPNQRTVGLSFSVPHRRVVSINSTLSKSRTLCNHRIVPYPTSARWDFRSRCPTGASTPRHQLSPNPEHLATTESSLTQPAHGGTFVPQVPHRRVVSTTSTLSKSRAPRNHQIVARSTSARWDFRHPSCQSAGQISLPKFLSTCTHVAGDLPTSSFIQHQRGRMQLAPVALAFSPSRFRERGRG